MFIFIFSTFVANILIKLKAYLICKGLGLRKRHKLGHYCIIWSILHRISESFQLRLKTSTRFLVTRTCIDDALVILTQQ